MQSIKRVPTMLSVVLFFGLLTGFASCPIKRADLPKGEVCFRSVEHTGLLLCENTLFEEGDPKREYERTDDKNDVVTNSDDYFKFRNDYIDIKVKYLICKKYPKKCQ